jgi:VanZ family protein
LFPNTTPEQLATIQFLTRKLAHFTEYAILALLAARSFWTSPNPTLKSRWFLIALGIVVVYSLIDEYHQSFVPSRTASLADSFIDMAGGLTALLLLRARLRANHASN